MFKRQHPDRSSRADVPAPQPREVEPDAIDAIDAGDSADEASAAPEAAPDHAAATDTDLDRASAPQAAVHAPEAPQAPAEEAVPDDAFVHDEPASPPQAGLNQRGKVRRTRVSALWVGLVAAAVLAIFLLIFIAQNLDRVTITFLGWEGEVSLAIALLLSAVIGILVVAVPGSLRIGQLRHALRKNARR